MKVLPKIAPDVARRIVKLRIAKGLNQADFGARVGVTQGYIAMLEKGDRSPSQALLIAMAVKFRISENYMRTGRGGKFGKPARNTNTATGASTA